MIDQRDFPTVNVDGAVNNPRGVSVVCDYEMSARMAAEYFRDREWVRHVGLATAATLAVVGLFGKVIGPRDFAGLVGVQVIAKC